MLLRVGQQIVEFLVRTIRTDIHPDEDLLVAWRDGVVEPEQPANIEVAFEFGRQLADRDSPGRRVQNECGGYAPC
jgi:hypothetical protein